MQTLIKLDNKITFWFQHWPRALYPYMFALTQFGSVALVVGLTLLVSLSTYLEHHYQLTWAFAAIIPGEVISASLKLVFNRARPQTQFARNMRLHSKSFPSGHACGSVMLYGLSGYLAFTQLPPEWNLVGCVTSVILIIMIGVSRIYLGAHYLFDVLGGWILGIILLVLTIALTRV